MKSLILISLMLIFTSACSQNKSSAQLKVTSGFGVTNPHFGGGLIIHGENPTLNKRFTIALENGLERSVVLDPGTWNFYAVGWDGDATSTKKFGGLRYCGYTSMAINGTPSVEITITPSLCSDPIFQAGVNLSAFKTLTCSSFYNYSPGTNTFSPVDTGTVDNFCNNMPMGMKSPYTFYRVIALEMVAGTKVQRFQSPCINTVGEAGYFLPTMRIPLAIRAYHSLDECNSLSQKNQYYEFPNGIEGAVADFDKLVQKPTAANARLFLPTSVTRRGTSPFMNALPKILCGTSPSFSDCIPQPNWASAPHVNVNWEKWNDEWGKVIYIGTTATTCPTNLLSTSKFFEAKNCRVEDGKIYADINRNELLCQPSYNPWSSIMDIHQQGTNVALTFQKYEHGSMWDIVEVYQKGAKLTQLYLTSNSVSNIAVSSNLNLFLAGHTGGWISRYSYNPTNHMIESLPSFQIPLDPDTSITDLEVGDNGILYVATTNGKVFAFNYLNNQSTSVVATTEAIRQIQRNGNYLYILDQISHVIKRTGLNLTLDESFTFSALSNMVSFSFDDSTLYIVGTGYPAEVGVFNMSSTPQAIGSPTSVPMSSTLPVPLKVAAINGNIYFAGSSGLKVMNYNGSNFTQTSSHSSSCSEDIAITSGGVTKTITFKSNESNAIFNIFREGLDILGLRTLTNMEKPYYIFDLHDRDMEDRGLGRLDSAADLLSANGIGGLLSEFPSCGDLKTHVASILPSKTYTKSGLSLKHPYRNETFTISLSVQDVSSNLTIPQYICNASPCSNYDLRINYNITGSDGRTEAGKFELACNRALGTYEYYENDGSRWDRRLYVWNTEDQATARFEEYSLEKEGSSEAWANLLRFSKLNSNEFVLREVEFGRSAWGYHGTLLGMEKTDPMIKHSRYHINGYDYFVFLNDDFPLAEYPDFSYAQIRDNTSLSGKSTMGCMNISNSDLYGVNNSCSFINDMGPVSSRSIELSIQELAGIGDSDAIMNSSKFASVFTINYAGPSQPAPTITNISPSVGFMTGGQTITVTGTGFSAGAVVMLGASPCLGVSVTDPTSLTCVTPERTNSGYVTLMIKNPDNQTARLSNGYQFLPPPAPTVTSIYPSSGSQAGGTTVTISGSGFHLGTITSVIVGGSNCMNVVVINETSLSCETTSNSGSGSGEVQVTNSYNQTAVIHGAYTYMVM